MKPISVSDALPANGQYVLIHLIKTNWRDASDLAGGRYWRVAKFAKGLSEEQRAKMKGGVLPDPLLDFGVRRRSDIYRPEDAQANNLVPFAWDEFGPNSHFGQDVDYWCELPTTVTGETK